MQHRLFTKGGLYRFLSTLEGVAGDFITIYAQPACFPEHVDGLSFAPRLISKPLLQECSYLQSKALKISPRVLDVRYADRKALVNSLSEITKSVVFSF